MPVRFLPVVVVLLVVLTGCTAPVAPSRATASPSIPTASSPSFAPTDVAYLQDVTKRLESSSSVGAYLADARIKLVGERELIDIGKSDCADISAGQDFHASNHTPHDPAGLAPFWNGVNALTTFIPAALAAYCPQNTAAFAKWASTPAGPQVPLSDTATLTITSNTVSASTITYATWAGVEQTNDAALPWSTTALVPHGGLTGVTLAINAQLGSGSADASISCSIAVAGVVKSTNTSTGPYSVVSCSL